MIELGTLNPYEVLDVDPRATVAEIKRAFQIALKTYGPGHMATAGLFTEEQREEILSKVHEAYNVLMDPERRGHWDEILRQKGLYPLEAEQQHGVSAPDVAVPIPPKPKGLEAQSQEDPKVRQEREQRVRELLAEAQHKGEWTGALLRQVREVRSMTLDEIAQKTKIGRGHLRSIEEDSYEFLPPDVYVKGFITQIAKVLGLDPGVVAPRIMDRIRKIRGPR
ncbi:MAG: helix-turn-helix domain-containing protein [bacterium]